MTRRRLLFGTRELHIAGLVLVLGFNPPIPTPDYDPAPEPLESPIIAQAFRDMQMAPPSFWQDPTEQVTSALEIWADAHATLLQNCDWAFASTFVMLSAVDPTPGLAADGQAVWLYRLPGDIIQLREVGQLGVTVFRLDGEWLRANAPPPLRLRYTARVTRFDLLPVTYRRAVALQLAVRLAPRWMGRTPDAMRLEDDAAIALALAKQVDGHTSASAARYTPNTSALETEGGGGDWASEATA